MVSLGLGLLMILLQGYAVMYLSYLWAPAAAAAMPGGRARTGRKTPADVERRFVILVSAHNEEAVISDLLCSLALQRYPAEKRAVYVVANNCTDATAPLVNASGVAACYERATGSVDTKGAALTWLWQRVGPQSLDQDCVLILDADNLVPPDYLAEVNGVFDEGYRVVQSARRAKNPGESWVSELDGISEALWCRLDQAGRMRLGLSAMLAGSGMAFEREVFEWLIGSGAPMLLEDIEWQARLMLAGIRVGYAARTEVYDEKTSGAVQLSRQRKRWMAGIIMVVRRYGLPLMVAGLRSRSLWQLTAGFGATKLPRSLLLLLMTLLALIGWLFPRTPALLPWPVWILGLGSFGVYVLLGMALDRARPRSYMALAFAPAFAAMMIIVSAIAVLRGSRQRWVPTPHRRSATIDQIRTK